jgi:Subtilase family/GEVED domain/Secretion system C-terminal sorting domain
LLKNSHSTLLFFLLSAFFSFETIAQRAIYNQARVSAIDENTELLKQRAIANSEIVKRLAKKLNIEIRRKLNSGQIIELKGVNEIGEPIFTIQESNLQASQTTHTNVLYNNGGLGLNITGSSVTTSGRLGIWDGGKVLNTHNEFGNRVQQIDNITTTSSHATHVAGTMVASGVNVNARGMAPTALLKAWDFSNDDAEMSAASKDLLVSNHSYGQIAGWVYNDSRQGDQKWEWHGNPQISEVEDYKLGFYDSQSQNWDRIAYNAPYYLIVKSAGNKGSENGPGISRTDSTKTLEKYFLGSSADTSRVARSKNSGYDNLPTYSVAKNVLTVGAVSIIPNGPSLASDIKIANFSSWGPTDDGRIKPDIVGAGVNLFSTTNISNQSYTFLSGTSMSSPQVAGSIFLLQELYAQLNSNKLMRSSTLKALALHTADDAGRPGPDYTYGWGLLNMEKAASALINKHKTHIVEEQTLNQNGTFIKKIIANGKEPLVATICWTDPEGSPSTAIPSNLNNRTPKLVNDLDMSISDGKINNKAWVLDPNKPSNNAEKGDNIRDNVEQVYIANPIPGKEYTITISHKALLTKSIQEYGLIISGAGGLAYCTSAPTSTADTKIEKITINKVQYTAPNGCTSFTDNTDKKIELSPGQKIDIELIIGSCGATNNKSYAIFVDWNIDGDFEDLNEKIAESATLSNLNSFIISLNAPTTITPGSNTRLRIVTSESNNIASCGSYSKGETMDFLLSYIYPKRDLALADLIYPDQNICRNTSIDNINILLKNNGTESINSGEINLKVFENNKEIANQKSNIKVLILGLSTTKITLPVNVEFKADAKYRFELSSTIEADENRSNDTFEIERTVSEDNTSTGAKVIDCIDSSNISLFSEGKGAAFWYDAQIGGNLLAVGNSISLKKPAIPTIFYASQNDLNGIIGPKTKKEYAGGTYSGNFGPKPIITTKAPIRLESARLYIGNSGKITFSVERISDQTPIATVTLDVTATRNQSLGNTPNGQLLDDPADPGAIYNLGLDIPEPGDYQIAIDYEDGASIFRSNQGVSGFPFSLQNTLTITGSSFNGAVLKEAWYYFYNLKVKSLGCASAQRTLATNSTATGLSAIISATNNLISLCPGESTVLSTNFSNSHKYQWFKDSTLIIDANKNSISVNQKGLYYLQISENGICPVNTNGLSVSQKIPSNPVVYTSSNTLTASELETYQWLLEGKPIVGANQKSYTAYETGNYSVQGKNQGCEVASFVTFVTILADENVNSSKDLLIFPNPAFDQVFINNTKNKSIKYQLFNQLGQLVGKNEIQNQSTPSISIKNIPIGNYFLVIEMDRKIFLKSFLKK